MEKLILGLYFALVDIFRNQFLILISK